MPFDGDPIKATLTGQQSLILSTLTNSVGNMVPHNTIIARLYPNPDDEPEDAAGVLRVQLCRLREKLREQGSPLEIGTVHGRGLVVMEVGT
jgi:DNA-binding response OmpR family regulator